MTELDIPKPGTKLDTLRKTLAKGATIEQLTRKLNWQPHTIRAAMTRLRKRGFQIAHSKPETGASIFKIEPAEGTP